MSDDLALLNPAEAAPTRAALSTEAQDPALIDVANWFRKHADLEQRFGSILRQSIDEVLDGQRTGRYDIDLMEKTEKTYLGTKVEIVIRAAFELPRGKKMDFAVAGHDVDSKFSMRGAWSIPTEAMGHLCLLTSAYDRKSIFDVGLVRITSEILNQGRNKDQKTTITASAKERIVWLARRVPLPRNLLLALPKSDVEAIMAPTSGQNRINELLRRVQGQLIERTAAVTVARQKDGLKRCRDARHALAPDGIVVLGNRGECKDIARTLGLPVPPIGCFVSVRLVPVYDKTTDRPRLQRPEGTYAVARPDEQTQPAPRIRYE
ncbi:NaeI family type II restriction endonuclease [Amycolatopsis sp. H20-H5]|uniref:NaeI family type II restriction endonuclease n=1 Tax=Amycolatopsis sp. H20-H5 TaxID=3046309 RepID=UPI002DBE9C88|nr:NaeI family type II restriction endonuclease [Amycolatopsis sp. H20-H5]MEC3979838.1 NaeI family type II restriction endonuclease [Amycolatopsis sp. H20-H5]